MLTRTQIFTGKQACMHEMCCLAEAQINGTSEHQFKRERRCRHGIGTMDRQDFSQVNDI